MREGSLRLPAVNRTRTRQEQLPHAGGGREIEHPPGAGVDDVQHIGRSLGVKFRACLRRRMNDVGESSGRKREGPDIARNKFKIPAIREVRSLGGKRGGIAGEDDRARAQAEDIIGMGETLQQPPAEKTRAAGEEQALTAQLSPQCAGLLQHVIQVFRRERRKFHVQETFGRNQ